MNRGDTAVPIKSSVWLGFETVTLPLELLTVPRIAASRKESINFGFLEDEFEIIIVKAVDSVLSVAVYRTRKNPNWKSDDGYALRFYFTLTGFDDEPQTAIMEHDKERTNPIVFFNLTNSILRKVYTTHHLFELFVVAHMLEFKSLNKRHENKKQIDNYMSFAKGRLSKQGLKDLSYILKSPGLKNTFTGRLPFVYLSSIVNIVAQMGKNLGNIAAYLKARESGASDNPNLDVNSVAKYFGMTTDEGPVPVEEAIERYFLAHKLGLDCFKTIASDYLVSILDKDHDVLNVLEAAILVHDKDLFEKAMISFLRRFHEVTRSANFQYFTHWKAATTRLIIHSTRIWVANNDVCIPSWAPTTEL